MTFYSTWSMVNITTAELRYNHILEKWLECSSNIYQIDKVVNTIVILEILQYTTDNFPPLFSFFILITNCG